MTTFEAAHHRGAAAGSAASMPSGRISTNGTATTTSVSSTFLSLSLASFENKVREESQDRDETLRLLQHACIVHRRGRYGCIGVDGLAAYLRSSSRRSFTIICVSSRDILVVTGPRRKWGAGRP